MRPCLQTSGFLSVAGKIAKLKLVSHRRGKLTVGGSWFVHLSINIYVQFRKAGK